MAKSTLADLEARKAAILARRKRQQEETDQEIAEVNKRIKQAEKEQAAAERKAETNRLIVIGKVIRQAVADETYGFSEEALLNILAATLKKASERKLFGLPPLATTESGATTKSQQQLASESQSTDSSLPHSEVLDKTDDLDEKIFTQHLPKMTDAA